MLAILHGAPQNPHYFTGNKYNIRICFYILTLCNVCLCAGMCTRVQIPWSPEEGIDLGLIKVVVSPSMGTGNQVQVLCKSSTYSYLLSHLSSPNK